MSVWHWLIVLAVVLVLFGGGGKLVSLMGDLSKGVKVFRRNLRDEDEGGDSKSSKSSDSSKLPKS